METLTPQTIADKVYELTEQFNRYVFDNPALLDHLPKKAVLVFLDADDPEFNAANIALARSTPASGPLVYINMQKHIRVIQREEWTPSILPAPLAA